MRISDWSSDVCSSDLAYPTLHAPRQPCLLSSAPMEDTPCPRDQRGSRDATQCRSTATTGVAGEPGHRGLGNVGGAPGHPVAADLYGRKSVLEGKSVSVRGDLGGRRMCKQNIKKIK